ncbi:hypothetical protein AX17_003760 [Amanita inopinata Kibby_2008]|nr:hypothetical protein AX17_003760 [Amanita inopinata Kibby_2008]
MSRLPRLHSSPDRTIYAPTMASTVTTRQKSRAATAVTTKTSLKRKAMQSDEDEAAEAADQPRKLPAIGVSRPNRPLQPSRTALNLSGGAINGNSKSTLPKPLPKTRTQPTTATRPTRGTSAPPPTSTVRPPSRPATRSTAATGASTTGRVVSGSTRPRTVTAEDKRFDELQNQLTMLESARAADSAKLAADMGAERAKVSELQANHIALSRELAAAKTQELTQRRELVLASDELERVKKAHAREVMDLEMDMRRKEREVREVTEDLRICRGDLEREREQVAMLKGSVAQQATAQIALTSQNTAFQAQVGALQSQLDDYTRTISELRLKLESAEKEVEARKLEAMESETVRRKLHNMVQELKGNIRVFCRVRPVLVSDLTPSSPPGDSRELSLVEVRRTKEEIQAQIAFPDHRDHKEIVLHSSSESATGQERKEVYSFGFDRVFEPEATQAEVFEEISQLAQSCTDGYNVCIFAYGQTGSGKSFTMEGGPTDTSVGMIPRAVEQVFRVAEFMKTKGWEYRMEGQFLEIYNETIHDLLAPGTSMTDKKHEIKHDPKTGATRVTELTVVPLQSPHQVRSLLALAQSRRSVAATLVNERSSRSHSVFTLRISGVNVGIGNVGKGDPFSSSTGFFGGTGERCEGSLNLVDLAGSERLNVSFAPGVMADRERVKETQAINKSLSALGDVIAALGERGESGVAAANKHIPYRNSKLTYLLQNSLSGNSKTLMVLNLSPLATHLQESLTSLRFATKVNNTTLGTAKKQVRTS